ncbi:hypothetical protein [Janthinobacterium fluminis]|uniref:Transporter n=1 Tax=Janthinobacterium fluminis TaxID=2987524 RepID=A0ABT5K1X4_9BURK|nr:hypothetical protein [Janthinobacterium fluminis]MDC8758670.1 hypothetical protein [Janthinobacterium fluminis]
MGKVILEKLFLSVFLFFSITFLLFSLAPVFPEELALLDNFASVGIAIFYNALILLAAVLLWGRKYENLRELRNSVFKICAVLLFFSGVLTLFFVPEDHALAVLIIAFGAVLLVRSNASGNADVKR